MSQRAPWTVNDFLRREELLKEELGLAAKTDADGLSALLDRIAQTGSSIDGHDSLLDALILNVLAIEWHGRTGGLAAADAKRVLNDALILLNGCGIKPGASRLSFLYGRIHKARSAELQRKGQILEAACEYEIARHLVYRPTAELDKSEALDMAHLELLLGSASRAIANARACDDPSARLIEARALRLSGAPKEALELLQGLAIANEELAIERDWEMAMCRIFLSDNKAPLCLKLLRGSKTRYDQLLCLKLWIYALGQRQWYRSVPKAESLRRRKAVSETDLKLHRRLYSAVHALDQGYVNDLSLSVRLSDISDACAYRYQFRNMDAQLTFLVAAAKHATAYSQHDLAGHYLSEYEALCLRLSSGLSKDVLGVSESGSKESSPSIAMHTGMQRTRKNLGFAAKTLGMTVKARARRALAAESERERLAEQELAALGEAFYRHLADLRGGLMKVGQFMSLAGDLPQELRASLALLRDSADPFPAFVVEEELKKAFGEPEKIFSSWDDMPLGVGSIGQIHRATLAEDGTKVAVKVRHPYISEAIRTDLKTFAFFKPVLKRMMPVADVDGFLNELKDRLLEETDFRIEARNQLDFLNLFKNDPNIKIPRVFEKYSSESVLVMEYVEGRNYSEFLVTASQEERDRAGRIIATFNVRAFVEGNAFNGDPHPGNYLFLDDGRIAFLDFGCCRRWTREQVEPWVTGSIAVMEGDFATFDRCMRALGYDKGSDKFDMREHWELARAQLAPLVEAGLFQVSEDYVERLKRFHTQSPNMKYVSPPPEFLLLMRVTFGLVDILRELQARANWREIAMEGLRRLKAQGIVDADLNDSKAV